MIVIVFLMFFNWEKEQVIDTWIYGVFSVIGTGNLQVIGEDLCSKGELKKWKKSFLTLRTTSRECTV